MRKRGRPRSGVGGVSGRQENRKISGQMGEGVEGALRRDTLAGRDDGGRGHSVDAVGITPTADAPLPVKSLEGEVKVGHCRGDVPLQYMPGHAAASETTKEGE